jgi:hypothetical protein
MLRPCVMALTTLTTLTTANDNKMFHMRQAGNACFDMFFAIRFPSRAPL